MKNLKTVLDKNYSKSSTEDVRLMVQQIKQTIGNKFNEVINVTDEELKNATKNELLNTINSLKVKYDDSWEDLWSTAQIKTGEVLSKLFLDDEFKKSDASNANFAAELSSIDFDKLISGPLLACVNAQTSASLSTASFIKEVGFDDNGKLLMVDFNHTRTVQNPNGNDTNQPTIEESVVLSVPLVSILSIPTMRIETCTIDFNVKLNSVYSRNVNTEFNIGGSLGINYGPVQFKVSSSYKRTTSTGTRVEKEYNMGVKIVATNDEMPAGLEKVLGILGS